MKTVFVHSGFEEQDLENKGIDDLLSELVNDFKTENADKLKDFNPINLTGTLILTYKNKESLNDKRTE